MYCKRCKKLYTIGNLGLCHECITELDDILIIIKEYLIDNKGASIAQICEQINIGERDVSYLIKVGRLDLEKDIPSETLTCKKCGTPISIGKYCTACSNYLGNLLTATAKKMDPSEKPMKNENAGIREESNSDPKTLSLYWRKYGKKV